MKKILVAGIGNIFFGDDAFGCEVVKALENNVLPNSVKLIDFGIKTRDLAYELCENYEKIILIDAIKTGNKAGTISLIKLNSQDFIKPNFNMSHEARIEEALSFSMILRAKIGEIYLVGCEIESMEELSETVKKSIVKAVEIVKNLIK